MKIVFRSGIEDRENGSFILFFFIKNLWNFWYPILTYHSIHSSWYYMYFVLLNLDFSFDLPDLLRPCNLHNFASN